MQCNSKVTFSAMKKQEVSLESRRNTTIKWVCSPKTVCMLDFEREGEREKARFDDESAMLFPVVSSWVCSSPLYSLDLRRPFHYIFLEFPSPLERVFFSLALSCIPLLAISCFLVHTYMNLCHETSFAFQKYGKKRE